MDCRAIGGTATKRAPCPRYAPRGPRPIASHRPPRRPAEGDHQTWLGNARFLNGGFWPRISSMNIYRWWIFSCLTIGMLGKTSVNGPCSMAIWNFLEGKANHIPSKMPTEMGGRFVPSPIRRLIVGFSRCLHLLRWKTISLLREKKHLKNGCFAVFHHDPKWMETQRPDMIMENLA